VRQDKNRVIERAYPSVRKRIGAVLIAQAAAAYILQGFALYPLQTAFYMRNLTVADDA
jgi:hypothetical protein